MLGATRSHQYRSARTATFPTSGTWDRKSSSDGGIFSREGAALPPCRGQSGRSTISTPSLTIFRLRWGTPASSPAGSAGVPRLRPPGGGETPALLKFAARSSNEHLQRSIRRLRCSIGRLRRSIGRLRRSIGRLRHSIGRLRHSIKSLQHSIKSLQRSIKSLRRSIKSLRCSIESLRRSIERLRSSIKSLRRSIKSLRSSIERLRPSIERLRRSEQSRLTSIHNAKAEQFTMHRKSFGLKAGGGTSRVVTIRSPGKHGTGLTASRHWRRMAYRPGAASKRSLYRASSVGLPASMPWITSS